MLSPRKYSVVTFFLLNLKCELDEKVNMQAY
jgi:hypothetical protein